MTSLSTGMVERLNDEPSPLRSILVDVRVRWNIFIVAVGSRTNVFLRLK